jgi:hypothetical protein
MLLSNRSFTCFVSTSKYNNAIPTIFTEGKQPGPEKLIRFLRLFLGPGRRVSRPVGKRQEKSDTIKSFGVIHKQIFDVL